MQESREGEFKKHSVCAKWMVAVNLEMGGKNLEDEYSGMVVPMEIIEDAKKDFPYPLRFRNERIVPTYRQVEEWLKKWFGE